MEKPDCLSLETLIHQNIDEKSGRIDLEVGAAISDAYLEMFKTSQDLDAIFPQCLRKVKNQRLHQTLDSNE